MQAKPPCSSPATAVHSPSPSTATGSAAAVPAYQRQSDRPPGLYTYTPSRATRGASASTQKRHINCVRDSDHALPGDGRRHRTGLQRFRQPVLESNTGSDLLSPPRHTCPGAWATQGHPKAEAHASASGPQQLLQCDNARAAARGLAQSVLACHTGASPPLDRHSPHTHTYAHTPTSQYR